MEKKLNVLCTFSFSSVQLKFRVLFNIGKQLRAVINWPSSTCLDGDLYLPQRPRASTTPQELYLSEQCIGKKDLVFQMQIFQNV